MGGNDGRGLGEFDCGNIIHSTVHLLDGNINIYSQCHD